MTVTFEIPVELESRLKTEAARLGVDEAECARQLLERNLPPVRPDVDQATLDLLAKWDKEDETDDPDEIARRNRDFEELKEALNRNRTESGGPSARRVFP